MVTDNPVSGVRVLVTGSRTWMDRERIREVMESIDAKVPRGLTVTLVSGGARGADVMAERIAKQMGWLVEQHLADWDRYGTGAGFRRNKEMVDLGADACIAFVRDNSRGATNTAHLAIKAGIPTRIYRA